MLQNKIAILYRYTDDYIILFWGGRGRKFKLWREKYLNNPFFQVSDRQKRENIQITDFSGKCIDRIHQEPGRTDFISRKR